MLVTYILAPKQIDIRKFVVYGVSLETLRLFNIFSIYLYNNMYYKQFIVHLYCKIIRHNKP